MTRQVPVAAVTGASGYLGSQICDTLESGGWQVVRLARSPGRSHGQVLPYDLATPVAARVREALRSANVLIHAAYNLSLTSPADIWRVNVEGTRRLLEAAKEAAVGRIIVFSTMSAFAGTSQLYGRAKLDIEAMTIEFGGCAVRPGLVYSDQAGGMAGAMGTALQAPVNTAALSRKIIYDGEIDLIVKDVDPIAKQVVTFIQDARGYIAEQSTTGSPGSQRSMRWKLRVPVEQFESLVQKVVALGELERNTRSRRT